MITLTPAYGRDYQSVDEALKDFNADKDFILNGSNTRWDGRPINKQQLVAEGHRQVKLRYGKLRKVAVVEVTDGR
jgi:hypothetical protein